VHDVTIEEAACQLGAYAIRLQANDALQHLFPNIREKTPS